MGELLRMEGIEKRFGSFYANRGVDLDVEEGEVHTLLGENGAGKSTLMNVLTGLYQPSAGSIRIRGEEVRIEAPADAVRLGIGMVHQHFMLVDAMTEFENIILGSKRGSSALVNVAAEKADIQEIADRYGLEVNLDARVSDVSIGEQQRVEILKVLYRGADLLILDEPTAVLTDQEAEGLFEIVRSLTGEGKSVIFISHKMREVMHISDRVTILRAGRSVRTLKASDTTSQELADLMMGKHYQRGTYAKVRDASTPMLSIEGVSLHPERKHGGLRDVSLVVHAGEILGIAGVDGNGQSQLARVATGLSRPETGTVTIGGAPVSPATPRGMIDAGVAHVPEDRNRMGLVGEMSIAENLVLKQTDSERFSKGHGWLLRDGAIHEFAEEARESNDIRCSSVDQPTRTLSGGNQQKVILARELSGDHKVLVVAYPTRGLDIGATEFVRREIVAERDRGCAVLLISADIDEVLSLSDRIAVLFEGEVMGIYPGDNPPIDEISLAMAGK